MSRRIRANVISLGRTTGLSYCDTTYAFLIYPKQTTQWNSGANVWGGMYTFYIWYDMPEKSEMKIDIIQTYTRRYHLMLPLVPCLPEHLCFLFQVHGVSQIKTAWYLYILLIFRQRIVVYIIVCSWSVSRPLVHVYVEFCCENSW